MAQVYLPEARDTATHVSRRQDGVGVDRIDINTLHATQVEPAERRASGFLSDGQGNIRIMISVLDQEGQQSPRTDYYYRIAGSRDWRRFSSYDVTTREGMLPIAVDGARNVAYVRRKLNGRLALY